MRHLIVSTITIGSSVQHRRPGGIFGGPGVSFFGAGISVRASESSLAGGLGRHCAHAFIIKTVTSGSILSATVGSDVICGSGVIVRNRSGLLFGVDFDRTVITCRLRVSIPFALRHFSSILTAGLSNVSFAAKLIAPHSDLCR